MPKTPENWDENSVFSCFILKMKHTLMLTTD